MFSKEPLEVRFWKKVKKGSSTECWPWLGYAIQGYGYMRYKGVGKTAPRISWELSNGAPFPAGMEACHTCDNPSCVNPAHIWAGTKSENQRDSVAKGRHRPARTNALKTHCPSGHEYSQENTALDGRGGRRCRTCKRGRDYIFRLAKKTARALLVLIALHGCASFAKPSLPPLEQRVLDLDPSRPGVAVYCQRVCAKKVIWCVEHKYECERYQLSDPEFWRDITARGFVMRVRERP